MPPTSRHSLPNIDPFVCEQLVRRAYSLQREWVRRDATAAHNWVDLFNLTHAMSLLPGGRHLVVASVEIASGKSVITVWDLEFPNKNPFNPDRRRAGLAKLVVPGPVRNLIAKYMNVKGEKGIVIVLLSSTPNLAK